MRRIRLGKEIWASSLFGASSSLLLLAGLAGCEGSLGSGAQGDGDSPSSVPDGLGKPGEAGEEGVVCVGEVCVETEATYNGPGEAAMRRLNNAEYQNTIVDLFGSAFQASELPADARTGGFDTLSSALAVSPIHIAAYMEAAQQIVAELFESDPAGIKAAWCDYQTGNPAADEACAKEIVARFAELAWRRPSGAWPEGEAETAYFAQLDAAGSLGAFPLDSRIQAALTGVLLSARFLYRVELADSEGLLDQASLASRLSYFLWSSAPDATLLTSDLATSTELEAQSTRLQADARFARFNQRFPDLWLGLEKLASLDRDEEIYPDYSPQLGAKMGEETRGFVATIMNDPAAPVTDILAKQITPTDPALVAIYGDSPRQGLVTQAAILAVTGVSTRTAPVRRGLWVLESLLCEPPPPPPPNIILPTEEEFDPNVTERERLEIHRREPSCAGCHVQMDPIGLGLENYDSIGVYRTEYPSGDPIDPAGALPGIDTPFEDAIGLSQLLAADERFPGCVIRKLFTYGAGREFERHDNALISVVEEIAGGREMTFQSALNAVVLSDGFRRRSEEEVGQ